MLRLWPKAFSWEENVGKILCSKFHQCAYFKLFGPVDNPNGVLCNACYRALNKYKISKKTSARVSK